MSIIESALRIMGRLSHERPKRRHRREMMTANIPAEILETRQLLAAQIVAPSVADLAVHRGAQVSFDVNYRTEGPAQASTDGLLLLMHYDSTKVTFNNATNTLQSGFSAIQDQPDTANADNNASTDRLVRALWFDANSQWPGQQANTRLLTANFTAAANLDGTTQIQFTGEPSDGHTFQSQPLTVKRAVPAQPVLTDPSGNVSATPTFSWTPDTDADAYELWVNNRSTGQTRVIGERNLTATTFTPSAGLPDGIYEAWVRAKNSAGSGSWSTSVRFVVGAAVPSQPVVTGPAQSNSLRPTFTWNPATDATSYEIWANNFSKQQNRVIDQTGITGTSFTPSADLTKGVYHIWIRAQNSLGKSEWSQRFVSLVGNVNEAPIPLGPLQPTFDRTPTFQWQAVSNASGYELYVRTTAGNTIVKNLTTTSYTPTQDLPNGPISWWVRTTDATENNGWSARSETNVEGRTKVTGPSGTVMLTKPVIQWQAVAGAAKYVVHVNNKATSEVVIREDVLTSTSLTPKTRLPVGTYLAWVKASSSASGTAGDGKWSQAIEFTVSSSPIVEPIVGATSLQPVTFRWTNMGGADSYILHLENAGRVVVIRRADLTSNSFTTQNSLSSGTYRVWVKAISSNPDSLSFWSRAVDFTIA
jgi:hypothetical protein